VLRVQAKNPKKKIQALAREQTFHYEKKFFAPAFLTKVTAILVVHHQASDQDHAGLVSQRTSAGR
jgi:hypothetical protein